MNPRQLRARYWRIMFFAWRVTYSFVLWEIFLSSIGLRGWARRTRPGRYKRAATRFRTLAVHMGGLMIKVGQFLSARVDILPPEIIDELAGLQDEVPAEDFAAIRIAAEAEYGDPLSKRFAWFDEKPLAAASLGQVHRARLMAPDAIAQGFADVVVKVQRPHIEQVVEVDLTALHHVGRWLQRHKPISDRVDLPALIEEFAGTTREEIDYVLEGQNAEAFDANFADNPRVYVPKVVWSQSARRVLTLEDVTAIKLTDYEAIDAAGVDRREVARVLLDTYLQQIFEDGFFHADPHPGNIFVTPLDGEATEGGREWRLTFIDFGMVGRLPHSLRTDLREVLMAVGTRDGARLVRSFTKLDILLPSADLKLIERASMRVFERFGGMSMGDLRSISHSDFITFGLQFRQLIFSLPFQLPENLLLLGRTIAILSGMDTALDPDFNLWAGIEPYAAKLVGDKEGALWQTIKEESAKLFQIGIGLPGRTDRVLTAMERGDLEVQTPKLNSQVRRLEHSMSRASSAIIFAALLIAGAILYPAEQTLATILMGASVVPLLCAILRGRARRWGR